jgi:hypothetical protein
MKFLKLAVLPLLGLSLVAVSAQARDRINVDINIGAYDYVAAPVVTHYPNTVYYGNTPTVIYYSAPTVVQYVPVVNTRFQNHGYYNPPTRNYYQSWSQGWRDSGHHHRARSVDRCERR